MAQKNEKSTKANKKSTQSSEASSHKEINWLDWSEETFYLAEKQDKLILLLVTASWCHWCRKLENEILSDASIADFANEKLIPLKVDVDRNPEVADRYVQEGGYPTFCLLTPRGEIIYGGNFLARDNLLEVLEQIHAYYRDSKQKILQDIVSMKSTMTTMIPFDKTATLSDAYYKYTIDNIVDNYDNVFGGFGESPKFPHTDVLELLLYDFERHGNEKSFAMVTKSLEAIIEGLHDKIDGGFYRYAATESWQTPHYEKLLEENCKILNTIFHYLRIKSNKKFENAVKSTLDYFENTLWNDELGVFASSQATDEAYYILDKKKRMSSAKPPVDNTIITYKNALASSTLLRSCAYFGDKKWEAMSIRILNFLIANCFSKRMGFAHYFEERPINQGLLIDQEAGVSALLDAYAYFGEQRYLNLAEEANSYTIGNLTSEDEGAFVEYQLWEEPLGRLYFINKPFVENSNMIKVLNKLYALTKNETYINTAKRIVTQFANTYMGYGYYFAANYILSVEALRNSVSVYVIPKVGGGVGQTLKELFLVSDPGKVVHLVERQDKELLDKIFSGSLPEDEFAIICEAGSCSKPITDIKNVRQKYFDFVTNIEQV